jgi:hypothetical protein
VSKYRKLETEYRSRVLLRAALKAAGLPFEEAKPGHETHLYGYKGDERAETATFAIRRAHVGQASNDLGWHWDPAAKRFVEVISEFDQSRAESVAILDQVRREYAVASTMAEARVHGLSVQRTNHGDGRITLRVVGSVDARGTVGRV